jgi:mannose-6-phosphate isomerase-like protein (cupin superfamily)
MEESANGPRAVTIDVADLAFSPTAALFEGHPRAGVDVSIFIARTPPGAAVELHVHPYAETFLLLEGRGRWTRGDEVVEIEPEQFLTVPPHTPHGLRLRPRSFDVRRYADERRTISRRSSERRTTAIRIAD